MKKIFFQLIIFLFLLSLTSKQALARDYFPQLENLRIGDQLDQDLQQQAEEVKNDNIDTVYLRFESASSSYPHYIELEDKSNQIIYIELKIPATSLKIYRNYLASLGEPETRNIKTQSLILLGYPSQGLGFIISNTSKNLILFTRYPIKTIESFRSNEAKNFIPVSQISSSPLPSPPPENVETNQNNSKAIIIIIAIITGVILVLVLFLITRKRKITYTMSNKRPENPKEI